MNLKKIPPFLGYGVMDDIGKGEKYLGNWSDNKKHGCGLIVTLDGIYYEGLFMQDVLTVKFLHILIQHKSQKLNRSKTSISYIK